MSQAAPWRGRYHLRTCQREARNGQANKSGSKGNDHFGIVAAVGLLLHHTRRLYCTSTFSDSQHVQVDFGSRTGAFREWTERNHAGPVTDSGVPGHNEVDSDPSLHAGRCLVDP